MLDLRVLGDEMGRWESVCHSHHLPLLFQGSSLLRNLSLSCLALSRLLCLFSSLLCECTEINLLLCFFFSHYCAHAWFLLLSQGNICEANGSKRTGL